MTPGQPACGSSNDAAPATATGSRARAGRRCWRRLAVAFALLACVLPAFAQSTSFRVYGQNDGLLGAPGCMTEDRQGTLWVCTDAGLFRYNGEQFTETPLDGRRHYVAAVKEDANGRLWVGVLGGLFVSRDGRFERVDGPGAALSLPATRVPVIATTPRGLAVAARGVAVRVTPAARGTWTFAPLFDAATRERHPELGEISSMLGVGDDLWLGCGKHLCRLDARGALRVHGPDEGVAEDGWRSFLLDRRGDLWARGVNRIVVLRKGATRFVELPIAGATMTAVGQWFSIAEDAQGRVLTSTDQGVARREGDRWRLFDRRNGFGEAIGSIVVTRSGDVWMGGASLYLQRWLGYDWIENWDAAHGLTGAPTWSILRDARGTLLFGNERQPTRLDPATQRIVPWGVSLAGIQLTALLNDARGALWAGHASGRLIRHDPATGATRQRAELPGAIRRMQFDRQGRLWLATTKGIFALDDPDGAAAPRQITAVPAEEFADIALDARDRLWFAGAGGVYRLERGRWTRMRLVGELPSTWIAKLLVQRDGTMWLGHYVAGVWRARVDGDAIVLETIDDRLLSNIVSYFLREDGAGRVWVGSNRGLDVYDGHRWARLSEAQGLIWNDVSENAFFADRDGSVWVGTSKGVSHILDPRRLFSAPPPSIRILRMVRGGTPVAAGASLGWAKQPMRIEVSTPGLSAEGDRVAIRYRMRGLQDDWIEFGHRGIDYPPPPAGSYVFEAQAVDTYRRMASPIVRIPFAVQPLWWQSPLAIATYALLMLVALAALWRWRMHSLVARRDELERVVSVRTHELQNEKQALEAARAELFIKASHDGLTGLLNRGAIFEAMQSEITLATEQRQPLAAVLIDLDHFKRINDQHGHLTGDAVLVAVASLLTAELRGTDRLGRYGGEELLVVLPGLPPPADERLRTLHDAISAAPVIADGKRLVVTSSMGAAWMQPGDTAETLLKRADDALYEAKRSGRNRVVSVAA